MTGPIALPSVPPLPTPPAPLAGSGEGEIAAPGYRVLPGVPELLDAAREVRSRRVLGIAAYKPPNSHPEKELFVFDDVGMLGLPLAPCHEFPSDAPAAFFPVHALKDADLAAKLSRFIETGRPVLLTDGLAGRLGSNVNVKAPNVQVLPVGGAPRSLLKMAQDDLDKLRAPLLQPLKRSFLAPNKVALYLFTDGSWVVANFNDTEVQVELSGKPLKIPARGWRMEWR